MLRKIPLHGKARGEDIFQGFYANLLEVNTPIHKFVLITTDGAPATTNENADLIELCKKKCRFPKLFFSFHSIIHQEALGKN
jgi:hypothetical protein